MIMFIVKYAKPSITWRTPEYRFQQFEYAT